MSVVRRRGLLVGWFAFLACIAKGAAEKAPLKLTVSLSKQQLRLGEPFMLAVQLKNTSRQNISLFRYLRWGYAGGLTIHVLDHRGRPVEAVEHDDDMVVPSELDQSQSYLILRPQQFLRIDRTDSCQNLFRRPGLYS